MIEQAEIKYFQGHEGTTLELSSGVNIISGRTHSGKSSIVRALKVLFENRPVDIDGFRKDGMPDDESIFIGASFSEDKFVTREKGKGINKYETSEHKDPFVAIRTDVPEEVRSVTKIGPENIQSQGDGYFLIDKTPGQVAKMLNKVIGLEVIDQTLSNIDRKVRDTKALLKAVKGEIKTNEAEIEQYNNVDDLVSHVSEIETMREILSSLRSESYAIRSVLSDINSRRLSIQTLDSIINNSVRVAKIKNDILSINELSINISRVKSHLGEIRKSTIKISEIDSLLENEEEILTIKKTVAEAKNKADVFSKIKTLYRDIAEKRSRRESLAEALIPLEKRRAELVSKLSYCGQCGADKKYWNLDKVRR